jgi:hypothetical protein
MSEGEALVHIHDWRAHGLVAGACLEWVGQVMLLHPAA